MPARDRWIIALRRPTGDAWHDDGLADSVRTAWTRFLRHHPEFARQRDAQAAGWRPYPAKIHLIERAPRARATSPPTASASPETPAESHVSG